MQDIFILADKDKKELYQWDLNQKFIVTNPNIVQVHFCISIKEEPLVCETYKDGEFLFVNIPNILLQKAGNYRAYACYTDSTVKTYQFSVISRPKPADYVYTETEVKRWEDVANNKVDKGFETKNGSKAFSIINIDRNGKKFILDSVEGLKIFDVYTVDLSYFTEDGECRVSLFADYGKITDISGTTVTVDNFPEDAHSIRTYNEDEPMDEEDNTFRIVLKPNVGTKSIGKTAFAMGYQTQAHTRGAVAFGLGSIAAAGNSLAMGVDNYASAYSAIALGKHNISSGYGTSVAIGNTNTSSGEDALAIGKSNKATNKSSVAIGMQNNVTGVNASALGFKNTVDGERAFASGAFNTASGYAASAIGMSNTAGGDRSFAAGSFNVASGQAASTIGTGNTVSGSSSVAMGSNNNVSHFGAFAAGSGNKVEANSATALGLNSTVSGEKSFTAGAINNVSGQSSIAMGTNNNVSGNYAFGVGSTNIITANYAMALGTGLIANGERQFVCGKYNVAESDKAVIVGRGSKDDKRYNAYTLDWNGNGWFRGDISFGAATPDKSTSLGVTISNFNNKFNTVDKALGEIATALQNHGDAYDKLLEVVGNKADKTEVYTKLEIDNLLGKINSTLDEIIALQDYYAGSTFDELHEYAQDVADGGNE